MQAYGPRRGNRSTKSATTYLGWRMGLGRSVRLSGVGRRCLHLVKLTTGLDTKNKQHRALKGTPHACPLAQHLHTDTSHTLGLRVGPRLNSWPAEAVSEARNLLS